MGSDLAAISWFFDRPYDAPTLALTPSDRGWALKSPARGCARKGVFERRCPPARELRVAEEAQDWKNTAIGASNLSQTELLVGNVGRAVATAEKSAPSRIVLTRHSQMMVSRTTKPMHSTPAANWNGLQSIRGSRTAPAGMAAGISLAVGAARVSLL